MFQKKHFRTVSTAPGRIHEYDVRSEISDDVFRGHFTGSSVSCSCFRVPAASVSLPMAGNGHERLHRNAGAAECGEVGLCCSREVRIHFVVEYGIRYRGESPGIDSESSCQVCYAWFPATVTEVMATCPVVCTENPFRQGGLVHGSRFGAALFPAEFQRIDQLRMSVP